LEHGQTGGLTYTTWWFAWPKLQEQFTYFDLMNAPRHVKERVINEAMARLRARNATIEQLSA